MKIHSKETAPAEAQEAYDGLTQTFGWTPNVVGVFAGSPVLIQSYQALAGIIGKDSAFTPVEQEIFQVVHNIENDCGYCMAAHSTVIQMKGLLPDDQLEALRQGQPLADEKQEAVRQFALAMFESKGRPGQGAIDAFKASGFTDEHILESIVHIAFKVITNYTNNIADPALDEPFQAQTWEKGGSCSPVG